MNPIDQHREAIAAACRRFGVRRLELFGSAARGDFIPGRSDFDFLVEFEDGGWKGAFKRYMGLKFELEGVLGASVDLVEPAAVKNSYFLQAAHQNRKLLYAA